MSVPTLRRRDEPEHVEDLREHEATQAEEAEANDTISYNTESTTYDQIGD
jgi:uncharacterized protein YdhG (YjbR/CyaY superfamily)